MVNPNWTRCQKAASVNEASIRGIFWSLTAVNNKLLVNAIFDYPTELSGEMRLNLVDKSIGLIGRESFAESG
jgi:hypothetical protein